MTKTIAAAGLLAALLSGCSLIPEQPQVTSPVPASWPTGPAYGGASPAAASPVSAVPVSATVTEAETAAALGRDFFRAPQLRRLIDQALANNRDLRVAALNIETARAQYRVRQADQLPSLDAGGSVTRQRSPAGVRSAATTTGSQYSVQASLPSFEIDLFGRVHSLEQQALEQYFATEEARASTQIALVAEVADAVLTLLADQRLLALTDRTLATRQQSLDLVRRSLDRGVGTELDLAQAQAAFESARASRERYVRQVAQDWNALGLLVGAPVDGSAVAGLTLDDGILADVPVGLSSSILLKRPDIRQAEHQLKAANANIGAARAAFYPTITLTGSAGTASSELGKLFAGGSAAWSFMPSISLPIFDGGRNEASLDSAVAGRDIAVAQYEKAIQSAFRDVADALAARGTLGRQLQAQSAMVAATQRSYDLAQARYDRGIDSFLNVLDAQRSLYGAQQDQISLELSRLSNRVVLYKSLGGGSFQGEAGQGT
ncbi:efflux transporter outer membrane subunit [Azospirillum thermophilum]|uniref:Multidrug transporter n=1 Tax=Azospirillum thermophilum TaxID=2202148 RepID=A0A2S2CUV7_9PROT|nr:efflux transporter outer membrane subunit [Azospirillum thermophilum]AWK88281.1 multidrug transporter [Azospirillum thermophilum]